ncbi:LacI family DNA-binding transcriptional regulator [Lacrimispora sp.]|uniref:LacI family DNA-binding transcriptional regulator n=1 Tax=Lacrimispora sp. TaxID=2719234 RepID=UPI002FD9FA2E
MATMKDVAARAGVSVSTVSFVLNGISKQHKVADTTAKRVLRAAKELGYHINNPLELSPDSSVRPKVIGIFFPQENNAIDLGIITENIYQYTTLQNLACNIMIIPYQLEQLNVVIKNIDWKTVDAAIIVISQLKESLKLDEFSDELPLVFYNYSDPRYNSVSCSSTEASKLLCDIIHTKEYKDIAVIRSESSPRICDSYFTQFLELCEQSGIPVSTKNYISVENSFYGGAIAARKLLNFSSRPSLILSANTVLAQGAIPVFARNKFFIPYNTELASFGLDQDLSYLQNHIPSLTMVVIPSMEMFKIATDLAFELIDNPEKKPVHRICQCKLIINESLSI